MLATAIEVTDDAPRSSRSDEGRSPFEDGQAPLLDGLVELKRLVDEADDEAWSLFDKWPTHDDSVMREISSRLRVVATMLAQAKERFEHKGAISPARSVRMSDRENNE